MSSPARKTSAAPKSNLDPQQTEEGRAPKPSGMARAAPSEVTTQFSVVAGARFPRARPAAGAASATAGGRRRSGFAVGGDGTTLFYEEQGLPPPATTILLCDGLGC